MMLKNNLLFILCLGMFMAAQPLRAQSTTNNGFSEKLKSSGRFLDRNFFEGTNTAVAPKEPGKISKGQRSTVSCLNGIGKRKKGVASWLKRINRSADTISLGDTLVIGTEPGEELIIDSTWTHYGPVLVIGDGILRFEGAQATIVGDIITAENGQVIADSSYLFLPQEYFYQRMLLLAGNSGMHFHHTTLDFGGMVHTMAVTGTSVLEFDHVDKPDFTTFGLYDSSSIIINSISRAGEFVVMDSTYLHIKDAATVLLWHQFKEGATADISFPDGDLVEHYEFNDQVNGVSGVGYHILLENCTDVMWGMMPAAGSDVTITDSDIRSVGFWFEHSDSLEVNGLVDNVHYDDFTVPLADRNFHLINCDVMTWSLYSYDDSDVDVSGSILGEIGAMDHSDVWAMNYYCDGSGGYLWATDTSFLLSAYSSVSASVRTSGRGIMIFAYSNQMNGLVQALGNSILILLQSQLTATPVYDPGAVIWMANITGPETAYQHTLVPVEGSAWIDKGNESDLMDFGYYMLYYREEGDTSWQMIGDTSFVEMHGGVLAQWNTQGLDSGVYDLKLVLWDDRGNNAEAITQMALLPDILGVAGAQEEMLGLATSPNPVRGNLQITFTLPERAKVTLKIFDSYGKGRTIFDSKVLDDGEHHETWNAGNYPGGIYYLLLQAGNKRLMHKIVVL